MHTQLQGNCKRAAASACRSGRHAGRGQADRRWLLAGYWRRGVHVALTLALSISLAGVALGANNGFPISIQADGAKEILFAAPLSGQDMGAREPTLRLAVLALSYSGGVLYCEWDLDENRCSFARPFSSLGPLSGVTPSPTDFAYTPYTPFPGADLDARSRPGDKSFYRSDAVWADRAFARTTVPAELVGSAAGRYSTACYQGNAGSRDCAIWAVSNWFSFAYSGCPRCCKPDGSLYNNFDDWPAAFCPANPWRFIAVGRNFTTDERWLHTTWAREVYLIAGATADANLDVYDWFGALGTVFMIDVSPSGSAGYMLHAEGLGFGVVRGRDVSSKSLYRLDTLNALSCPIWTDTSTSQAMLHDVQLFAFFQRGVAYFASYVRFPDNAVVPRIRLCHFGGAVELPIEGNLTSIAPVGYSYVGSAMYLSTTWQANAEAIPPGAVAHAMAADGRVEAGGPLLYHAILRTPFFPTSACPTSYNRGLSCVTNVTHVIARWTFAVDPAANSARLLRPPSVIHARTVSWIDTWILQNERPGLAGPGIGALEGKWVEGRRFSWYVLGDEVVRFARPGAFESGIGGVESGRIRLQPAGWSPSVATSWYSVPAAVYKSGSLFIVRELHTPSNTLAFDFGRSDFAAGPLWMTSSRLRKIVWRSKSTHLIKIDNVNDASFSGPFRVVIPSFTQGIVGGHVLGDFSSRSNFIVDDYNTGSLPYVEAPFIAFYARSPAFIVKIYTECPPGTSFNVASVNGNTAGADCVPLPPGLYSNRTGLISTDEANVCNPGTFSTGGATTPSICPAGTYSQAGASSCYDCPQNTASSTPGTPCSPCNLNAFTQTSKWTSECLVCTPGTYLPYTGASVCLSCPPFTYSGRGALGSCAACGPGLVPSSDASTCEPCPAGTYQAENRTSCRACPLLTYSHAGAFGSCISCREGYISLEDRQSCIACTAGYYRSSNMSECMRCPPNTVTGAPGLASCTECAQGYVSAGDQSTCIPCASGTYRAANMTYCVSVPTGAVAPAGSVGYTLCSPGEVPNAERSECRACGKGNYEDNLMCRPCVGNTFNPHEASRVCLQCDGGYYASADKQSCQACLPGQYRGRNDNVTNCRMCPFGSYSTGGAAVCTQCQSGRVSTPDRTSCEPCRAGTYESGGNCVDCPINSITPQSGATACEACAAGLVSSLDRTSCRPCEQGTVRPTSETSCRQCPFGFYTPAAGAATCTPCPRGTESSDDRSECRPCTAGYFEKEGRCWPCPLGTYSGMGAFGECPMCPPGTTSNADRTSCGPCPPGLYANYTFCIPCPAGSISLSGDVTCKKCPPGAISSDDRTKCNVCPAGTFQGEGQNNCFPCKQGEYAPEGTYGSCLKCDLGSYSSPDSTRCISCEPGSHMAVGSTTCEKCPANTYSDLPGRGGDCKECDDGHIPGSERRSCIPCRPGQFRNGSMPVCMDCPPGSISSDFGASVCSKCPAGEVPREDAVDCTPCPAGSVPGPDALTCAPCAANAIAPSAGGSQCQLCPAGHHADEARRACVPCPAGTRMPAGALACVKCGANSVSGPGSASCDQCQAGYEADDGLVCAACSPGSFRNASMLDCTPCPPRAYAADSGSLECLPCPPDSLCPVGTSEPHSLGLSSPTPLDAPPASTSRRHRLLSRRLLGFSAKDVLIDSAPFEYGNNTGTVAQATVRTEEEMLSRTNKLFAIIGAGAVGATALAGLCIFVYLRLLSASSPEQRAARYRRIQRLHLLFHSPYEAGKGDEAPAGEKGAGRGNEVCARAGDEPWSRSKQGRGAGGDGAEGGAGEGGGVEKQNEKTRTVSGAVFTLLAVGAVAVAVSFVLAQYMLANYSIVQRCPAAARARSPRADRPRPRSLNPGVSPSAGSIAGTFAVSATFRGYRGVCRPAVDAAASPAGFAGTQALATATVDARESCKRACAAGAPRAAAAAHRYRPARSLTWTCAGCRIASASGADITLRLSARLAYAVSILYTIQVPEFVTASGFVKASREDAVFRGATAVPLPVALTPMHFTSTDDGRPRYFAALSMSDTASAERDPETFGLCSPGLPLTAPECAGESVAVAVSFRLAEVYVLVDRKIRSTALDALANGASLAAAAMGAAGQACLAYLAARRFLRRKYGLQAHETDEEVLAAGEDEAEAVARAWPSLQPIARAAPCPPAHAAAAMRRPSDAAAGRQPRPQGTPPALLQAHQSSDPLSRWLSDPHRRSSLPALAGRQASEARLESRKSGAKLAEDLPPLQRPRGPSLAPPFGSEEGASSSAGSAAVGPAGRDGDRSQIGVVNL